MEFSDFSGILKSVGRASVRKGNAEGQYKLNKFKQLKKPFFNKLLKNTY